MALGWSSGQGTLHWHVPQISLLTGKWESRARDGSQKGIVKKAGLYHQPSSNHPVLDIDMPMPAVTMRAGKRAVANMVKPIPTTKINC